jgi:hypothetical protein
MAPVYAHHSLSAYDSKRQTTLEGVITEFHFVNPHPFLLIKAEKSEKEWALEMDNRSEMVQAGITAETLRVGDRIIVTGNPSRDGGRGLYINKLQRPADGFEYEQVNGSPKVRPKR